MDLNPEYLKACILKTFDFNLFPVIIGNLMSLFVLWDGLANGLEKYFSHWIFRPLVSLRFLHSAEIRYTLNKPPLLCFYKILFDQLSHILYMIDVCLVGRQMTSELTSGK